MRARVSLLLLTLFIVGCSKPPHPSIVEGAAYNDKRSFNYHMDKKKHSVDEQDHLGKTALMHAVCNNNLDMVKALTKKGARTNIVDKDGKTALHHLCDCNPKESRKMLDYLLEGFVPLNVTDKDGVTAFLYAVRSGDIKLIKKMIESGANIHLADSSGRTPLMAAAAFGNTDVVKLLIKNRVDVNAQTSSRMSAYFFAAQFEHKEIMKLLKKAGAEEIYVEPTNEAKLLLASEVGNAKVVGNMIIKGVDINLGYEGSKQNALMKASANGHGQVVDILIKAGADLNAKDKDGKTALMFATINKKTAVAKMLLDAGADKSLRDNDAKTAKDYAIIYYAKDLLPLL